MAYRSRKRVEKKCKYCRESFESINAKRSKYCSESCRVMAYMKRKKIRESKPGNILGNIDMANIGESAVGSFAAEGMWRLIDHLSKPKKDERLGQPPFQPQYQLSPQFLGELMEVLKGIRDQSMFPTASYKGTKVVSNDNGNRVKLLVYERGRDRAIIGTPDGKNWYQSLDKNLDKWQSIPGRSEGGEIQGK